MTQVSDTDLSIIIPVYQVSEELLLRCLKSVQEIQDLRKEVILVADGPDQEVCSNPAIQAFAGEAEFKISFYEKQHEGERGFFSWMQMITSVQMLLGKSVPC